MIPLDFWDMSLFLAFVAATLTVTSGLISSNKSRVGLRISKRRLRNAALAASFLFLATVAVRVVGILLNL